MNIYPVLSLLATASIAMADISLGRPEAPKMQEHVAYHADLLASNAVHAVFKEIRTIPVVSLESHAPQSQEVAVFEVKQNLAYRRYDRMGDFALQPGKLFPISLAADVPGQDAALGAQIRDMQPGDEAIMNIDHIYLFKEAGNENVRACTRFAKVQPKQPQGSTEETTQPAAPAPSTPDAVFAPTDQRAHTFMSKVESRINIEPDGNGGVRRQKVETRHEWINGKESVRKFINDVEVDPTTDQPLAPAATPAEPPAASAPQQPAAEAAAEPAPAPPIPDPAQAPEFGF